MKEGDLATSPKALRYRIKLRLKKDGVTGFEDNILIIRLPLELTDEKRKHHHSFFKVKVCVSIRSVCRMSKLDNRSS